MFRNLVIHQVIRAGIERLAGNKNLRHATGWWWLAQGEPMLAGAKQGRFQGVNRLLVQRPLVPFLKGISF